MSDNYVTLLPGQEREITVDYASTTTAPVDVMMKQYGYPERRIASVGAK